MLRVSVIIPTYNRAETLPRAIDSVLEQTVDDLEVIVVDDGSSDDTESVLAAYDAPQVHTVAHETNRGANVARNTGIEHARGEYVAFLDSDDAWHPKKLERQLETVESRSSEWVGAYCDSAFELSGPSGQFRTLAAAALGSADDEPTMEGGEALIGEILADNVQPGAGSTLLVRTDVAREVGGFDERLDRFQDPEFCLRLLEAGNLAYVDEVLVLREETGYPPAEVIESADEQYLSAYEAHVERFEAAGYEIRSSHELVLAKRYFAEGRLLRGARHLHNAAASPRQYPGVCWAIGTGIRRRPAPLVAMVAAVAAIALVLAAATGGRRATLDDPGA